MKSYHLTPEQALKLFDEAGGILDIDDKCPLAVSATDLANTINAALDQVLGEPVGYVNEHGLEMLKDSQQAKVCATLWRTGMWDSANVALYAPKELP